VLYCAGRELGFELNIFLVQFRAGFTVFILFLLRCRRFELSVVRRLINAVCKKKITVQRVATG